jgi:precorrin-6A synthase
MASRLLLIGIGAGNSRHLTQEAIAAIAATDVFVVIDKADGPAELGAVRRQMLDEHASGHRIVELADARRDDSAPYAEAVQAWHLQRVNALERVLLEQVGADEVVGLLVWGDPSLYDSTLRVVDQVLARGRVTFEHAVIPGVSSLHLLAARHRITLNRVGRPVHVTTGRLLRAGLPDDVDDVVVMLDGATSFTTMIGRGFDIYWGAYLGMPEEILLAGPLDDVADEVVRARSEARARLGWVFDIYLLRRRDP